MDRVFGFLRFALKVRMDMRWLTDQAMAAHTLIALMMGGWALLVGEG